MAVIVEKGARKAAVLDAAPGIDGMMRTQGLVDLHLAQQRVLTVVRMHAWKRRVPAVTMSGYFSARVIGVEAAGRTPASMAVPNGAARCSRDPWAGHSSRWGPGSPDRTSLARQVVMRRPGIGTAYMCITPASSLSASMPYIAAPMAVFTT